MTYDANVASATDEADNNIDNSDADSGDYRIANMIEFTYVRVKRSTATPDGTNDNNNNRNHRRH